MTEITVALSRALKIGETEIPALTLREPTAGELRGVKLSELLQGEAGAVARVLARVATPAISEPLAAQLSARDLVACYVALSGFFVDPQATDPTA